MKFNDYMSRPGIPGKRIRFKGEVNITFRDVRTGRIVDRVSGHNMQTDALDLICNTNYNGNINYDDLKPLAKTLCGGILCFQNTLTESAGNIWPPNNSVNPVIAHAGQTTYQSATADNTRGLPNDSLSGPTANGYKLVWDWPATQGNGRISAVALTHKDTGDWWLNGGTNYTPIQLMTSASPKSNIMPIMIIDDTHRTAITLTGSGTTLQVRKYINYSLLDGMSLSQEPVSVDTNNPNCCEIHTYTMPVNAYQMKYLYFKSSQELHCLYFHGTGTGNVKRVIINVSTNTATTSDFTVPDANLKTYGAYSGQLVVISLDANGYCYAAGNDDKTIYKFLYSDPTQVSSSQLATGSSYLGLGFMGVGNIAIQPNIGVIVDNDRAFYSGYSYDSRIDSYGNRQGIVPINGGPILWAPGHNVYGYNDYTFPAVALCKYYMATVRNLPEAKAKDPTQSMQIEYILTETAEE